MDTTPLPPLFVSVTEAAKVIGLGTTKTKELVSTGQLRTVKAGRRRLVPVTAITELARRLETAGEGRTGGRTVSGDRFPGDRGGRVVTAEAAGAVPDDVNRLAGMVERHLTALAQVIHTAAEKGSHAAIEEVADYLNGCDAVDPDKDPAAYIAWLARPDTPESSRRQDAAAASDAGTVPDDVIAEVAQAIFADAFMGLVGWDDITEGTRSGWRDQAHAALSVPSVAEVFARDAKVRELDGLVAAGATEIQLWRWESGDGWCAESDSHPGVIADGATPSEAIAALYSEDGAR